MNAQHLVQRFLALPLVLVLAGWSVAGYAQIQVRGLVGLSVPHFENGENLDLGVGLNVQAHYLIKEKLGLGLASGFSRFTFDRVDDASVLHVPVHASIEYNIGNGSFVPFLGLELGPDIVRVAQSVGNRTVSESETYFGLALRGGGTYFFSDAIGLTLELKEGFVFMDDSRNDTRLLGNLQLMVGVTARF
jgi:hypothetical protein